MPSTLTARGEDGKQSKKIERNTRKAAIGAILLCFRRMILLMFARGWIGAQLKRVGVSSICGVGWAAFASKPAPTVDRVHNTNPVWEGACSRRGR